MLIVSSVKAAYEKELGRKVPASSVYRWLERHGWRKIVPRPSHPKADPQAQDSFKKNFASLIAETAEWFRQGKISA
jgi:transposase